MVRAIPGSAHRQMPLAKRDASPDRAHGEQLRVPGSTAARERPPRSRATQTERNHDAAVTRSNAARMSRIASLRETTATGPSVPELLQLEWAASRHEYGLLVLRVEDEVEFTMTHLMEGFTSLNPRDRRVRGTAAAADRKDDLLEHGDILRASTDYVSSLTEQDAEILFRRLTGVRLGALTDVLHT